MWYKIGKHSGDASGREWLEPLVVSIAAHTSYGLQWTPGALAIPSHEQLQAETNNRQLVHS